MKYYTLTVDSIESINEAKEKTGVFIQYLQDSVPSLVDFAINIVIAVIILFVGKRIIKGIRKMIRRSMDRTEAEAGVIQFVDSFVKFLLYTILIMIIVSRFGIETSSILALLGSAGLAIGLAIQGSLSNFAGGVLILLMKPYRVGDYIIVDGGKNEGTVKEIQIFYTKIVTIDNKQIMIPNGGLANNSIVNVSAQKIRRLDLLVGVSYHADLKSVKKIILDLLEAYEKRIPDEIIQVYVDSLGDSAVMIGARIWVPTEEYLDAKWTLTERIKLAFDENNIEIPFNQLDVKVVSNTKE